MKKVGREKEEKKKGKKNTNKQTSMLMPSRITLRVRQPLTQRQLKMQLLPSYSVRAVAVAQGVQKKPYRHVLMFLKQSNRLNFQRLPKRPPSFVPALRPRFDTSSQTFEMGC